MRVVFIHGALVRDGDWWWRSVAELLARDGIRSEAALLPSCGESAIPVSDTGPGLAEDAESVRRLIASSDEDTIVVASSYGGTVAAEAAELPNVRHLVYISSFLPNIGENHATAVGDSDDPLALMVGPNHTMMVDDSDPAAFDRRFLQDVADASVIRGAHERLAAQSPAAFLTPTTAAAWQLIPSTYLVCADDRNTGPDLQRMNAARATRSVELPTGHHPFLSRPDLVAAEIIGVARGL